MTRPTKKHMKAKPVKAWAYVHETTGIDIEALTTTQAGKRAYLLKGERIARVEIREVTR